MKIYKNGMHKLSGAQIQYVLQFFSSIYILIYFDHINFLFRLFQWFGQYVSLPMHQSDEVVS